jgi:hypothetical protein
VVNFVANKHVLTEIKQRFEADFYLHMDGRELDRLFALEEYFSRSPEYLLMKVLDDDEAKAIDEASQRVQMKHPAFTNTFSAWNDSQRT